MSTPLPAHLEAARRRAQARDDERALTARTDNGVSPTDRSMSLAADPLTEDDEVTMVDMRGLGAKALHRLVSAAHGRGVGADEISAALHELCVQDEPSMEAPAWAAGAAVGDGGNATGAQGSAPPSGQGGGVNGGGGAGGNGRSTPKPKPPQEGPVGETRAAVHAVMLQLLPDPGAYWNAIRGPLWVRVPSEALDVLRDTLHKPTPNAEAVLRYMLRHTPYENDLSWDGVYLRYLRAVSMFVTLDTTPGGIESGDWRNVALELTALRRDLTILREIAVADDTNDKGGRLAVRDEDQQSVRTKLLKILIARDYRIEREVPLNPLLRDALIAALDTPTRELASALTVLADNLGPQPLPRGLGDGSVVVEQGYTGPEYDAARLVHCFAKYADTMLEPDDHWSKPGVWNVIGYTVERLERDLDIPIRTREEERARHGAGWLAPLRAQKPQSARRILLIGALAASVPVFILGALSAYLAAAMGWLG